MSDFSNFINFLEFVKLLTEDKLMLGFTEELIQTSNPEDNDFYSMGHR